MKTFKIINIFFAIFLLAGSTSALGLTNSSIVAVVNNDPITVIALNNRLHTMIAMNNIDQAQIDLKQMKEQVLHMLIDEKLMAQAAVKGGIVVSEAGLEEAFKGFAEKNNLSEEQMMQALTAKQIQKKELLDILKAQMIWSKIVKEEFIDDVTVSEQEIKEQFEIMRKYQKTNSDSKLKLAEIVLTDSDQQKNKVYAENVIAAVKAGGDFQKLVQEFSTTPSKENNGEIGWVQLSQLAPQLANALKDLKKDQISQPIEQENIVMIFKVLDRQDIIAKKLGVIPTVEEKQEIEGFLKMKKVNAKVRFFLTELKRNAFIEIKKSAN